MSYIDLDEGLYNARDVLGMCRVYKFLAEAVQRTGTLDVYTVDKQMALLATQMTRVGMPIDEQARQEMGEKLRVVRDEAAKVLLQYVEGDKFDQFVNWIALYQAAKPRKDDPQEGQLDVETGVPYSAELAMIKRQQLRRAEFLAKFEKSAMLRRIYEALQSCAEPVSHEDLAAQLALPAEVVASAFRAWATRNILTLEKRVEGTGKSKRTLYLAQLVTEDAADADDEDEPLASRVADALGGINLGAKIQQIAILRVAGVELTKLSAKTGLPQVSKETLEELGHHPVARHMLDWMLTAAAIRNVVEGYKTAEDGRLHPQWMIHKITGRWGSSPNVQNVSKRAGGGRVNLRSMFVAPPGYVFVGADFAQLEARIIAAASQDPFLLGVFQREEDIHGALAGVAFPAVWPKLAETYAAHKGKACGPVPTDPKSKCEHCKQRDKLRDLTKRLEYGAFYGGSADTLWQSTVKDFPDLKLRQVHEFLHVVGVRMNGVLRWRANVLAQAEERGEIRSPILGRRQVFPLGRVEPTVAYNYIPQSGGADLWALGALDFMQLWDQFDSDDARICHNGHDSILILCKECFAEQVKKDVEKCWTRSWGGVTFKIEAEHGKRWSDT